MKIEDKRAIMSAFEMEADTLEVWEPGQSRESIDFDRAVAGVLRRIVHRIDITVDVD